MNEKLRTLALELAINANPPIVAASLPAQHFQQAGLLGYQPQPLSNQASGSFYTAPVSSDKILKDAAAFLTFLAPEKPNRSPKSRKARL